ncbi:MAG: MoxR family ATPase [Chroococcidiopsidaceae cyanobacterium CP_BM_RX_35]|nr:MoxR family ATPase [Chroococcidiopsidaceae cyanobacterium CP_BM_RX_35]
MTAQTQSTLESVKQIQSEMQQAVIGQDEVIERLIIALLANGNVLLEGLPGLAKTRSVKSMAKVLEAGLSRIQFTPDLLPSDVTGTEIYQSTPEGGTFQFQPGPIFNNLVLADEINRAPAKVQSALLEAMEERQVTVAGTTHKLPELFMVLATQNPIEQEGTYPLPEAQLDRFLMKIYIDYPTAESEQQIVRLVREEEKQSSNSQKRVTVSQQTIFDARQQIQNVCVSEAIETYTVDLISATRYPERYSQDLKTWIQLGASPRGSIGLDKCSRVHAWMQQRDYVTPDDLRAIIKDVLRHRIALSYAAQADSISCDRVIEEIVKLVAVA